MFQSIVIAFDGSAHASRALEIGADIGAHDNSRIGIIYVIDNAHMTLPENIRKLGEVEHFLEPAPQLTVNLENAPESMMHSLVEIGAASERIMFQYGEYLVGQARQTVAETAGTEVETSVMLGDPADEIVDFARKRNADLIITGCRGLGKLKSLVLGSTSHKVTQLAECSCLTVK